MSARLAVRLIAGFVFAASCAYALQTCRGLCVIVLVDPLWLTAFLAAPVLIPVTAMLATAKHDTVSAIGIVALVITGAIFWPFWIFFVLNMSQPF